VREPAGLDRQAHGARHPRGILGPRDRAGQQDPVAAELHGHRCVRRRADPGVEDHRNARALEDESQVVGIGDAHATADRRAERHHRGAAGVLEPSGQHGVVAGVRQDGEPVADERLGGLEQLRGVGEQGAVVADDLELDPVGLKRLAREPGRGHRVAGGEAAGRVRQDGAARIADDIEHRSAGAGVDPAHGHRGHLRS
jgi:hypothetical protein